MAKTTSKTHLPPDAKSPLIPLSLELSPTAQLYLYSDKDSNELLSTTVANKIREFFTLDASVGLLHLGLSNLGTLPASLSFWQRFSQNFIAQVCRQSNAFLPHTPSIIMPADEIEEWMATAPFMRAAEYLTLETASVCWERLLDALIKELKPFDGNLSVYLEKFHAAWSTVGRVCFHLAENKANTKSPFAFLATYTTRLSNNARAQHVPLGRALEEYSGQQRKAELLSLLLPVQKASEKGLFPHPKEIKLACSCPDWADICKHVAAVLYGIGARLDQRPEELFLLRQADHLNLIAKAGTTRLTSAKKDQNH